MTEIWFYHLEYQPLDKVLPVLLQRSLERGWRVCVETTGPERVKALDDALWTYDDASFLPHGVASDGNAARQPILLTETSDNLNGAVIRFLVDAADPVTALEKSDYQRLVLLFDGRDDEAVRAARHHWTVLKKAGHAVTYWQQDQDGRWDKRA